MRDILNLIVLAFSVAALAKGFGFDVWALFGLLGVVFVFHDVLCDMRDKK